MLKSKKTMMKKLNRNQKEMVENVIKHKNDPQEVKHLLDFMNRFYKYSFHNASMIASQWAGATAVDSYAGWKKRGFPVKRGEKGRIKILVPAHVTLFTHDGVQKSLYHATKEEKQLIHDGKIDTEYKSYFRFGTVFEMSQTNARPEDYPKLYPNKHIDYNVDDEAYRRIQKGLNDCLKELGVSFATAKGDEVDMGNAKGYYVPKLHTIMLNQADTRGEKLTVLVHELGHAYLKQGNIKRGAAEMQAEMVAYLVSKHFGIDVSDEATDYIAGWTNNLKDVTGDQLQKLLKATQSTALQIIRNIEKHTQD